MSFIKPIKPDETYVELDNFDDTSDSQDTGNLNGRAFSLSGGEIACIIGLLVLAVLFVIGAGFAIGGSHALSIHNPLNPSIYW